MNDIEFIETLKQKRNACDYSQSRLAQELQISRQNLNEIENVNNPVPVSLLSGDRKPQIRFLGNHPSGSGNLYHKSFRM